MSTVPSKEYLETVHALRGVLDLGAKVSSSCCLFFDCSQPNCARRVFELKFTFLIIILWALQSTVSDLAVRFGVVGLTETAQRVLRTFAGRMQ